jgi:hypothetical protein
MNWLSENPRNYDFSDIQIPVYQLNEEGILPHTHVNPLYLEPVVERAVERDKKEKAYFEALFAVGAYFKELTEDNNAKALAACRKYADICAQEHRRAFQVKSVEDLLG